MSEKILSFTQILLKRKFILLAVLIFMGVSGLSLGYSQGTASAAGCSITFMCDFNTNSTTNTAPNNPGPQLAWTNSGISLGGSGTNADPYQVTTGSTVNLNLGYESNTGTFGYHVFSWTNIDPSNLASNVIGAVSASGGDANAVFAGANEECFDMAFTSNSPYYNPQFAYQASSGGVVSCDGTWPCQNYTLSNPSPGCPLDPVPGGYAVTGHGDNVTWYENNYGGGYNVTHNLSITTQNSGEFCLRNHVAISNTGGWVAGANYLAGISRDVVAMNYNDICFDAIPPVTNPPPSCSEVAIASPGANNQVLVYVADSNGNVLIPNTTSTPSTTSPTTNNYQGDGTEPSWKGTWLYIVGSSGGGTWAYNVLGQNVRVVEIARTDNNGVWTTTSYSDKTINCYNSTINSSAPGGGCQMTVNGNVPYGPSNAVEAGSSFTISATVTNNGPGDLPASLDGDPLQVNPDSYNYNAGPPVTGSASDLGFTGVATGGIPYQESTGVTLSFTAPSSAQTLNIWAHPTYNNLFNFGAGSDCTIPVVVYQPFTLNPAATSAFVGDPEDPTAVTYTTSLTNNSPTPPPQVPVYATDSSSFNFSSSGSGSSTSLDSSSDSGYDFGTKTELTGTYTIPLVRPGLSQVTAGDSYCTEITVPYTSGWVGPVATDVAATPNSGETKTSSPCAVVVNKPYFKVYGSGASADGLVADWNNWSSRSNYDYGGGSELANIAAGDITGYAGGQQSSTDIRPPADLDFANDNNVSPDPYTAGTGGNAGNSAALLNEGCVAAGSRPWSSTSATSPSSGSYSSGSLTLGNLGQNINIANGQNICLNVTGNVYINSNIVFTGANNNTWTVGSSGNVPSFTLNVTGGNIYIDPSVGELDGLYAAEPGGGGGTIYTCGVNSGGNSFSPMADSSLYTGCHQQLTVDGSFEAQSVDLMRTYGSLRDETPIAPTTKTAYDNPVELGQFSCGVGPGGTSDPYAESHWYEAVNSSGAADDSMVVTPGATGTCPTPTLQTIDGLIFPPGDTTFTSYVSNNNLYGNYNLLCEYEVSISGTDDHYMQQFGDSSGQTCATAVVGLICNAAANTPCSAYDPILVGYLPSSAATGMELLYENYDGPGGGPCNGAYATSMNPSGCTGFHYYSTLDTGEADGGTFYVYNGALNIITSAMYGAVPYQVNVAAHPPSPLNCSNNGGTTSPRPTCAAEVFDFSPEFYLSNPPTEQPILNESKAFNIYNLPPVL